MPSPFEAVARRLLKKKEPGVVANAIQAAAAFGGGELGKRVGTRMAKKSIPEDTLILKKELDAGRKWLADKFGKDEPEFELYRRYVKAGKDNDVGGALNIVKDQMKYNALKRMESGYAHDISAHSSRYEGPGKFVGMLAGYGVSKGVPDLVHRGRVKRLARKLRIGTTAGAGTAAGGLMLYNKKRRKEKKAELLKEAATPFFPAAFRSATGGISRMLGRGTEAAYGAGNLAQRSIELAGERELGIQGGNFLFKQPRNFMANSFSNATSEVAQKAGRQIAGADEAIRYAPNTQPVLRGEFHAPERTINFQAFDVKGNLRPNVPVNVYATPLQPVGTAVAPPAPRIRFGDSSYKYPGQVGAGVVNSTFNPEGAALASRAAQLASPAASRASAGAEVLAAGRKAVPVLGGEPTLAQRYLPTFTRAAETTSAGLVSARQAVGRRLAPAGIVPSAAELGANPNVATNLEGLANLRAGERALGIEQARQAELARTSLSAKAGAGIAGVPVPAAPVVVPAVPKAEVLSAGAAAREAEAVAARKAAEEAAANKAAEGAANTAPEAAAAGGIPTTVEGAQSTVGKYITDMSEAFKTSNPQIHAFLKDNGPAIAIAAAPFIAMYGTKVGTNMAIKATLEKAAPWAAGGLAAGAGFGMLSGGRD